MKLARLLIALAVVATPMTLPTLAQAKSVKWRCVAGNPLTPWIQTCTGTVNRP